MDTKQLIKASATIVKIVNLKKGDIVKTVSKAYSDKYKMKYAIITDVLHDGESAYVNVTEYSKSYGTVEVEYSVWGTDTKDFSIFPATRKDLEGDFKLVIQALRKQIKESKESIIKKENQIKELEGLKKNNLLALTTPEHEVLELN